jgi:pyruvate carboxylase subunit B
VLNVLTGERYKTISNEVKLYLQGRYGRAPGRVNSIVRQQAIGNEDAIDIRPADLLKNEMDDLRDTIAQLAHTDEDVLTYAMFPDLGRDFLEHRASGTLVPEPMEPITTSTAHSTKPTEFNVTLHGETYHIQITGTGHHTQHDRPFYMTVDGVPEEILIETLAELEDSSEAIEKPVASVGGSKRPKAVKPGDVTTSMPCTVVEVLVEIGSQVNAGDPVLVTEAMKMETEIQAPIAGTVQAIHVSKGDSVNPDETLIELSA